MLKGLLSIFFSLAFVLVADALVLKDDYRSPRNPERRVRKATTLIVLHTTEAHAKSSLNKLSERGEAHYCVVEDGTVYRIIDKNREAYHAGRSMWSGKEDCDEYTIGIEVVGHHDKPITDKQIKAINELVAVLQKTYKLKDSQVICHSHVAYGAPNKWHKKKHRGRKRCGMLFAMPSVRGRLGLTSRPAYDPDVKAKRLVQGDKFLERVLYGNIDTMAKHYSRGKAQAIKAKDKPAQKSKSTEEVKKPAEIVKKPVDPIKKSAEKKSTKVNSSPAVKIEPQKEKKASTVERGEFKKNSKLIIKQEPKKQEPKKASKEISAGELKKKAKLIKK
jgi:hypothetical protein